MRFFGCKEPHRPHKYAFSDSSIFITKFLVAFKLGNEAHEQVIKTVDGLSFEELRGDLLSLAETFPADVKTDYDEFVLF